MWPGMEELLDAWWYCKWTLGVLEDIMDGAIWKSLKAPDGSLFFDTSPNRAQPHELRIGLTLGFDGYVYAYISACFLNVYVHIS